MQDLAVRTTNSVLLLALHAYDTEFTNGGDMKSVNDFKLSITQSQNGANMDITYKLEYLGSSPSQTVYLLAVVVEETGPDTYNDGSTQPHNVIRSWLLNSANNNFESFTLTPNNPVTKTWTEPVSSVRANGATSAADNFVSVGAIMNGDKSTWNDVYAASDSTMGPKIDIGISNFAINNPSSSAGYVRGDTLTLEATVQKCRRSRLFRRRHCRILLRRKQQHHIGRYFFSRNSTFHWFQFHDCYDNS